jgi:hypothetical protein
MSIGQKLLNTYIAGNAAYAFYRGWNDQDGVLKTARVLHTNVASPNLYTDRFRDAAACTITLGNPLLIPITAFYIARRTEKWMRGIKLTKEDYDW